MKDRKHISGTSSNVGTLKTLSTVDRGVSIVSNFRVVIEPLRRALLHRRTTGRYLASRGALSPLKASCACAHRARCCCLQVQMEARHCFCGLRAVWRTAHPEGAAHICHLPQACPRKLNVLYMKLDLPCEGTRNLVDPREMQSFEKLLHTSAVHEVHKDP